MGLSCVCGRIVKKNRSCGRHTMDAASCNHRSTSHRYALRDNKGRALRFAIATTTPSQLATLTCIPLATLATLRQHVCNKLYRRQTLRPANFVHNTTQRLGLPTTHPQMPSYARPFWETPTLSFVYSEPTRWLHPVYDYPQQRSTGGLPQVPLGGYIH